MREDDDARWRRPRPRRASGWCRECHATPTDPLPACTVCGVVRCRQCPDPCVGCARLATLRALLAGKPTLAETRDPRVDKTLHFVLTLGATRDVLVTPARVSIRSTWSRGVHEYFGCTGPGVVGGLMQRSGLTTIGEPTDVHVPEGKPFIMGPPTPAQHVWLYPRANGLEMRFRPDDATADPLVVPEPQVIRIYVDHAQPVHCPHCSIAALRHRAVGHSDAIVCAACGRSFVPG